MEALHAWSMFRMRESKQKLTGLDAPRTDVALLCVVQTEPLGRDVPG